LPIQKLKLPKLVLHVKKTGLPYYDASRLIGVAHLFFGTASAEIEDKGGYWEISGIDISRDDSQVSWIIETIAPQKSTKSREPMERKEILKKLFTGKEPLYDQTLKYFQQDIPTQSGSKRLTMKAEYDVALQIATRGIDPLSKYEALAPRSTSEVSKHYKEFVEEVVAATFGRGFAANVFYRTKRQTENISILPIFSRQLVVSGYLDYRRSFTHRANSFTGSVLAALSILEDLRVKRLPVIDFAFTKEVKGPAGAPIFSESGILGFDRLCGLWLEAVEHGNESILKFLTQGRRYLFETARIEQGAIVELARWVAKLVSNPNIGSFEMVERHKARILASGTERDISLTRRLLSDWYVIKEVGSMVIGQTMPEIPYELVRSVAEVLSQDEKGWMNKLTRLENASTADQFIAEIERLVSRGAYRASEAHKALSGIKLETLCSLATLSEPKAFRATKSVFLLQVLSQMKRPREGGTE